MRKIVLGTLMALLVFSISFGFEVTTSSHIQPRQSTNVRFLPQPLTVQLYEEFTVACVIEDVSDLSGFDISIAWDPAALTYISHIVTVAVEDYPNPIPPSPYAGILHNPKATLANSVNAPGGTYWLACTTLGGPTFNGSGTVFVMTFEALWPGTTLINFTYTDLVDNVYSPIPHISADCVISIVIPTIRFPPQPLSVEAGQEFMVECVVEDVSNLYGFDIQIKWDTNYLSYINHTKTIPVETYPQGILHSPTISIMDHVDENASLPDSESGTMYWLAEVCVPPAAVFNGNGTAFEMWFEALAPTSATWINFTLSVIVDDVGNPMVHAAENASVGIAVFPPHFEYVEWEGTSPFPYEPANFTRQGEPVLVTANITDDVSVADAFLSYCVDGGFWWNTTMTYNGSIGLWETIIPGQLGNATVEFFLRAYDNVGSWNISFTYSYDVTALLRGDINGDGDVDLFDAVKLLLNYGGKLP